MALFRSLCAMLAAVALLSGCDQTPFEPPFDVTDVAVHIRVEDASKATIAGARVMYTEVKGATKAAFGGGDGVIRSPQNELSQRMSIPVTGKPIWVDVDPPADDPELTTAGVVDDSLSIGCTNGRAYVFRLKRIRRLQCTDTIGPAALSLALCPAARAVDEVCTRTFVFDCPGVSHSVSIQAPQLPAGAELFVRIGRDNVGTNAIIPPGAEFTICLRYTAQAVPTQVSARATVEISGSPVITFPVDLSVRSYACTVERGYGGAGNDTSGGKGRDSGRMVVDPQTGAECRCPDVGNAGSPPTVDVVVCRGAADTVNIPVVAGLFNPNDCDVRLVPRSVAGTDDVTVGVLDGSYVVHGGSSLRNLKVRIDGMKVASADVPITFDVKFDVKVVKPDGTEIVCGAWTVNLRVKVVDVACSSVTITSTKLHGTNPNWDTDTLRAGVDVVTDNSRVEFCVKNNAACSVTIDNVSIEPGLNARIGLFSLPEPGPTSMNPWTIPPGRERCFTVEFHPTAVDRYGANDEWRLLPHDLFSAALHVHVYNDACNLGVIPLHGSIQCQTLTGEWREWGNGDNYQGAKFFPDGEFLENSYPAKNCDIFVSRVVLSGPGSSSVTFQGGPDVLFVLGSPETSNHSDSWCGEVDLNYRDDIKNFTNGSNSITVYEGHVVVFKSGNKYGVLLVTKIDALGSASTVVPVVHFIVVYGK